MMDLLRGIGRFCYDFIVGDDWKVAASVVTALLCGGALLAADLPETLVVLGAGALIVVAFSAALVIDVRTASAHRRDPTPQDGPPPV